MQSAIRTLTLAAVLFGGGAACQTTPRLPGQDVEVVSRGALEALNPNDVAVVPIQVASPGLRPPTATLRRSASLGLIRRRYSPLSAERVDEAMQVQAIGDGPREASYAPGDLQEDAVLEVTVTRWNDSNWDLRRALDVALEARLVDPRDPLGPPLWAARVDREFRFPNQGSIGIPSSRAMQNACDEIFTEIFSQLPPRDTTNGLDDLVDAPE